MQCPQCGSDDLYKQGFSGSYQRYSCKNCGKWFQSDKSDYEISEDVFISNKEQKSRELANFQKKRATETVRNFNAIEELYLGIVDVLKNYKFKTELHTKKSKDKKEVGILQLSDLHFNELIDLPHNKFDFDVASKRLHKFADKAMLVFGDRITEIKLVMTGDLLNSNRRADELMSMATNRASALIIASEILAQLIVYLNQKYNIEVHYVVGNESRIEKDLSFSSLAATDNFDFLIAKFLEARFNNCSGVTFVDPLDPNETIIKIGNKNILALHGFNVKTNERFLQSLLGKYANNGIIIHYVIFGHLHSCVIGDFYARSSSLAAANSFSDVYLGLTSRASQNIFIVSDSGIDGSVIDLQNIEGYSGFDFTKLKDVYNPKSTTKTQKAFKYNKVR